MVKRSFLLSLILFIWPAVLVAGSQRTSADPGSVPVTLTQDTDVFTPANGYLTALVSKRSGILESLKYNGVEMLARGYRGAEGGYWSSVGRGRPGAEYAGVVRIDPATNGGVRAEISCELHNDPQNPSASVDADYRYALGRGDQGLYVYAVLVHRPGFPPFGVGEARYCLKLNPEVFDFMTVDADRRRVMPSGYDWDHGAQLNLKEARRMTTGVHKGEPEHKYDYSAVLAETPAYGWSSTKQGVGFWLINPSQEYIGGGPTKAELTGHLDVNPGGLPTLLNMWVGSHYGGTTISVATNEYWSKVVGPFLVHCNGGKPAATSSGSDAMHRDLWQQALGRAKVEARAWPYGWVSEPLYPLASARSVVSGQLRLRDSGTPAQQMSNIWVGVTAPDYLPPRMGGGFGFRRPDGTNAFFRPPPTNFPPRSFGGFRGGFPPEVDWQRDAKFYQYWARADADGRFHISNVRPGAYTLHAIADGVLGEFAQTNVVVSPGKTVELGALDWQPARFGRTVWQIGVPDRTAREFRHGDHYWQWGLYFQYPNEFPQDVNYVVGKSDWRRDWNYVQPPRIEGTDLGVVGEEDESRDQEAGRVRGGGARVRSSTWTVRFDMDKAGAGTGTLRLAFCGTHVGCNVEVLVNGKSIGETGPLPSTSAMQRDGIRAYWIEKDLSFDAAVLKPGENQIELLSHANSWSQGVMYDCVRLELDELKPFSGKSG